MNQVRGVISKHSAAFAAGGATMTMKVVHGNFWVQIDINPNQMAVGLPGQTHLTSFIYMQHVLS